MTKIRWGVRIAPGTRIATSNIGKDVRIGHKSRVVTADIEGSLVLLASGEAYDPEITREAVRRRRNEQGDVR
jgi:hypothetical protein